MDARDARAVDPALPPLVFVYQGTVSDGAAFFGWIDPTARAVADLPGRLYSAFGLGRGRLGQMFGREVWACGMRASRKGHSIGRPVGDPWMMPGFFLVEGGRVIWEHRPVHAGDHPEFAAVPRGGPAQPAGTA